MLNCERLCIKCLELQITKLNYIRVHGACDKHMVLLSEFEKCIHCDSIVPVISFSPLDTLNTLTNFTNFGNQEHNSTKFTVFNTQISMPTAYQRIKCEWCNEESETSESKCHKICQSCYSNRSTCPICINSIRPQTLCQFCNCSIDVEKKSCGHTICSTCCSTSCNLCQALSQSSLIVEPNCDYCMNPSELYNCDQNIHYLCSACLESGCLLCNNRSTLRGGCEFCHESFDTTQCKNGHNLCEKCSEKCILCSDELITLDSSHKTGSFGHFLKNNSILERIDEVVSDCEIKSQSCKMEDSVCDIKTQSCKMEEDKDNVEKKKFERIDKTDKHYHSNLVKNKDKPKKGKIKGGDSACKNCLMM